MSLIKCPECSKEISDKAERCINCGYPISSLKVESRIDQIEIQSKEDIGNGEDSVVLTTNATLIKNKWFKPTLISICAFLLVILSYNIITNHLTKEGQAKQVVNDYLKAIQDGESSSDFEDFLYADFDVDDFDDVYDFEFEKVKGVYEVENKTLTLDREFYEQFDSENYSTFEEFKEHQKETIETIGGKVIDEDDNSITLYDGKKHDKIALVYKIDASHYDLGDIDRRVTFTVENDNTDKKFMVTSFFW
ncbi:zinc ribbon domain-containing protein [Neobacillus sp. 179-J 1A1 HS]|uniref:zinc ribbon domain-containing protein n=1 Tax=Neobacillus driksii TaxID=3035913 RepID=UPI0035BBA739